MAHGDITHTEIPFDDKQRAMAFYRDVVGWDVQEHGDFTDYPMWRAPNQVSGGGMGEREGEFRAPRFYVEVDSIDDVVARVGELGGRLVEDKDPIGEDSWVAVVADPDGNQIGLYQGTMAAPETVADPAPGDIAHVDIPVSDMTRATVFYGALVGWDIQEIPGFEGYPMWQAPNGVSGGGLAPRSDGFTQPRSYIQVDSIDDTLAKAGAAGGRAVQGRQPIDETSWWAVMEDSEGNQVGLTEGASGGEG